MLDDEMLTQVFLELFLLCSRARHHKVVTVSDHRHAKCARMVQTKRKLPRVVSHHCHSILTCNIEALCSILRSIHGFVQNCVTTRTLEIFWKIYTPAMLKATATTKGWRRQTVKPNANPSRDSPNMPVLSPVPVFQMYLPHFQTVFYLAQDIFFASWVVIFLTPVQGRFPQKMLVESWKFSCQQQYCANFNVRSTGKFVALKRTARKNTLALWRPMNLRESVY